MCSIAEDRAVFPSLDLVSPFNPYCREGFLGTVIMSSEIMVLEAELRVWFHTASPLGLSPLQSGAYDPAITLLFL